jgi:hypothetical protein
MVVGTQLLGVETLDGHALADLLHAVGVGLEQGAGEGVEGQRRWPVLACADFLKLEAPLALQLLLGERRVQQAVREEGEGAVEVARERLGPEGDRVPAAGAGD